MRVHNNGPSVPENNKIRIREGQGKTCSWRLSRTATFVRVATPMTYCIIPNKGGVYMTGQALWECPDSRPMMHDA